VVRAASKILVLIVVLLVSAALVFPAQGDGDIRLSEIIRDSQGAIPIASTHRGEGAARALDSLLAGRNLPIPCASPLLMELWQHREALSFPVHESLRLLTLRPSLPHESLYQTRDGRFAIHYTLDPSSPDSIDGADADLNGIPDRVDQVEEALARAVDLLAARLSWPLPLAGPRADTYDIYLVSLGPGRDGFTAPDQEIGETSQDDASSHILVDGRLDPARTEAAVIHQFAHASLLALSDRAPVWWNEATAAWMETLITGDPSSGRAALSKRLDRLDLSLVTDSLLLSRGDSLWVSFLADRHDLGEDEILRIWQEESLRGSVPLPGLLDEILSVNGGGGLSQTFRSFTRWALFTGRRDDGEHFRLGQLFPELTPKGTFESLPAQSLGAESVEPLGAAVYRLVGDGSRGGVRVRFGAEEASSGLEVDLVITPRTGDRRPYLVEMVPDSSGTAEVGIPWRDVAEAMMIVRNPSADGHPARYRFSASLDPLFPFDLSSFATLPTAGGIALQWSTGHEQDLLGWNVLRGSRPGGPFQRINPVTLPSGGDSDEETDYIYQDDSAQKGRRYFYLVEGITIQGLAERSFPVSGVAAGADSLP
jgi:hypothetical protein